MRSTLRAMLALAIAGAAGGKPIVFWRAVRHYRDDPVDPDWGPTLIQDWSFTPTEQGRRWRAALLGQPLPPE